MEISNDKLLNLRNAIDEYLKSYKFLKDYNESDDIKILINGGAGKYGISGPATSDFSLTDNRDMADVGTILEYIVTDNKMKVYQAISDCMSYATAS